MDKERANNINYGLGVIFIGTLLGSAVISIIALTIKFVMWLF